MRVLSRFAVLVVALSSATSGLHAQLAEACPDAAPGESALLGYVTDPSLSGMPVFGALVTATWMIDGERRAAEGVVPDDGVYLICGVPREVRITVRATFSGRESEAVEITVREEAVRQDLTLSIAGEAASPRGPLLVGPGPSGRCPDLRAPNLVRCVALDECRYRELEEIRVTRMGGFLRSRELVERFVQEARQKDVDAVRRVRAVWEQLQNRWVLVLVEGQGIEFTEERCKRWVTDPLTL